MGYRLNRLDEPIFMAGPKPMRTEFGIHQGLESCASDYSTLTERNDMHEIGKAPCILVEVVE